MSTKRLLGWALVLLAGAVGTIFAASVPNPSEIPAGLLAQYQLKGGDVARYAALLADGRVAFAKLSRAEYTRMVVDAFNVPKATPATPSFSDVGVNNPFYPWIEGAKAAGLLEPASGQFFPNKQITHEDAFGLIVRRIAGVTGVRRPVAYPVEVWAPLLARYADGGQVSAGLQDEVAMAIKYRIFQPGDWNGNLVPQGDTTTIEAVAFITRGQLVLGDRIAMLGVWGGPPFNATHVNIGTLLFVNGQPYLIDIGGGTPNNILKLGLFYGRIKNVFVTHLHLDHMLGYPELVGRGFLTVPQPQSALEAWGPPGLNIVNESVKASGLTSEQNPIIPIAHEIGIPRTGIHQVYEDANVVVKATYVYHDGMHAYAYRFEIKSTGKSVVFSGDVGPGADWTGWDEQLEAIAQNATVLVHEAQDNDMIPALLAMIPDPAQRAWLEDHLRSGHTDVRVLPDLAKRANVGTLILNHYTPGAVSINTIYNKALATAAEVGYTGRIVAPEELDVIGF